MYHAVEWWLVELEARHCWQMPAPGCDKNGEPSEAIISYHHVRPTNCVMRSKCYSSYSKGQRLSKSLNVLSTSKQQDIKTYSNPSDLDWNCGLNMWKMNHDRSTYQECTIRSPEQRGISPLEGYQFAAGDDDGLTLLNYLVWLKAFASMIQDPSFKCHLWTK